MSKLIWVWTNRDAIAASFIAFAAAYTVFVATPLSRVIKRPAPSASWWKRLAYDLCIDTPSWLAALEHSGILGGIFNVPGVPSRAPEANPTPAASKLMQIRQGEGDVTVPPAGPGNALLVLLLAAGALGMVLAGCGTAGGKAWTSCELGKLPATGQVGFATAQQIASNPNSTAASLEAAGLTLLPGQLECGAVALLAWLESLSAPNSGDGASVGQALLAAHEDVSRGHARQVLREYLQAHKPSACGARQRL